MMIVILHKVHLSMASALIHEAHSVLLSVAVEVTVLKSRGPGFAWVLLHAT